MKNNMLLKHFHGMQVQVNDEYLGILLTSLLQDDRMRNKARRTAYHFGRRMTWNNVANKLQDIFPQLVLFN